MAILYNLNIKWEREKELLTDYCRHWNTVAPVAGAPAHVAGTIHSDSLAKRTCRGLLPRWVSRKRPPGVFPRITFNVPIYCL